MWEERYSGEDYVYGTEPNEFLVEQVARIPGPSVLCIAEGEGRNAVWLAERVIGGQALDVTMVEGSTAGCTKAHRLAKHHSVELEIVKADLRDYDFGIGRWDAVVSIFGHLPSNVRAQVYPRLIAGLRPGGVVLLEAYRPAQLQYDTGGPPTDDLMMNEARLRSELAGLDFPLLREIEREVVEGTHHTGHAAVVQMVARKPNDARGLE